MIALVAPARSNERHWRGGVHGGSDVSLDAEERVKGGEACPRRLSVENNEQRVLHYSGRMLAVARRMLRHHEDADDAVQDAMVSALAAIHQYRANAQLYTWLHRIVVNACLMKLRSQKRRPALSLDALFPSAGEAGDPAGGAHSFPSQAAERAETRKLVRACIDRLPEDYRAILILRDIEELDTDATAGVLGLSRAAVKTRLHRARRALRALLETELEKENAGGGQNL